MNIQEALHLLKGFSFPAKQVGEAIEIHMEPREQANEITREEIHAALQYKVPLDHIRQIDPWSIVIAF